MTRVLCTGDWHLDAGTGHRVDALGDQEAVLNQIANLAIERDVDLVLHAGDVFHRPRATVRAQHILRRFTRRLAAHRIPMVIALGNASHDQVNAGTETIVELEDSDFVRVSRRPEVITDFAGVAVCTLPSTPLHLLDLATGATETKAELAERAADYLHRTACELRDEAIAWDPDAPAVLLAHWSFAGARLPNGLPVDTLAEPVIDTEWLRRIPDPYAAIVAGHIHEAQLIGPSDDTASPAFYTGSPLCLDFGEANTKHGVWVFDIEPGEIFPGSFEFVELDDRRFLSVHVDITEPAFLGDTPPFMDELVTETSRVAQAIRFAGDLQDAIVRVSYRATEEQHRRVDHEALIRLLDTAHRVYGGIQWEPVRTDRARVAGVDETLAPLEALTAWAEAHELEEVKRGGLLALAARYLEEGV